MYNTFYILLLYEHILKYVLLYNLISVILYDRRAPVWALLWQTRQEGAWETPKACDGETSKTCNGETLEDCHQASHHREFYQAGVWKVQQVPTTSSSTEDLPQFELRHDHNTIWRGGLHQQEGVRLGSG